MRKLFVLAAATCLLWPASAAASLITLTYTGHVTALSFDTGGGLFSPPPPGVLVDVPIALGDPFVFTLMLDLSANTNNVMGYCDWRPSFCNPEVMGVYQRAATYDLSVGTLNRTGMALMGVNTVFEEFGDVPSGGTFELMAGWRTWELLVFGSADPLTSAIPLDPALASLRTYFPLHFDYGGLQRTTALDVRGAFDPPAPVPVPEPASLLLVGGGLVALIRRRVAMR